ncbi:ISL3 family transposase [Streptomyces sp. ME03-5684b]|uniref:ISL3 family transposase n=1 Tax=Streptomyces sp. ME03-5684b TaxID=3028681 RepID=UPI0029A8F8D4|nr:ISL3 family transposase [Streptomyces sp. ME03-5684b]MDX3321195.1 ISL3 family transposase [Streptomyces sp. ME03-5684b]
MFSGLSALVIEDVADSGEVVRVSARTRDVPVPCPVCGVVTGRVHAYHGRTVRDVPIDGRQVVVRVRIRRLVCPVLGCRQQTFREQVPGLLERHQRRTTRLTGQLSGLVKELCGRASARLSKSLATPLSYTSALRLLRRVPVPVVHIPRVIGVDDFALRRRHSYATIIIDAETGQRIEVLPGREAAVLEAWLRTHPSIEAVCRDGSTTYAETIRRALPDAVQISDRWHLWHNLAEAVRKEVAVHSACWAKAGPPPTEGRQAATTRERWQQIHALRERGVGLLECTRRLNLALNTVKRYDRVAEPERLIRAPKYRPTLVDPYRDHLRQRRLENPAVPVTHLLREIRELGYTGSSNLLVRYINQGRVEADRPALSPRRLARYLLTRPDHIKTHQQERIEAARAACHEMTALADLIHRFAALPDPADGNATRLSTWITSAQEEDLPHLHAFTRGIEKDRAAVDAALTLPHHNGGTEGVNNKTKLIKRQMYGRASFPLLRHRILLG